jgi:hypothetical protein
MKETKNSELPIQYMNRMRITVENLPFLLNVILNKTALVLVFLILRPNAIVRICTDKTGDTLFNVTLTLC